MFWNYIQNSLWNIAEFILVLKKILVLLSDYFHNPNYFREKILNWLC